MRGSIARIQFSIMHSNVEIFDIRNDKKFHTNFLDELRSKYRQLIIQAIDSKFLLNCISCQKNT